MHRRYLALVAALVISAPSFAQPLPPDTVWTRCFDAPRIGDGVTAVFARPDGGLAMAGSLEDTVGRSPSTAYLRVVDGNGDMLWERRYRGAWDGIHIAEAVQSSDGGYLLAGTAFTPDGAQFILLVRLMDSGDTLWTRAFAFSPRRLHLLTPGIRQTADGGFILAVSVFDEALWADLVSLFRVSALGDSLWLRSYPPATTYFYADQYDVEVTGDGGFLLIGRTPYGESQGLPPTSRVIRTTANGALLWTRMYGAPGYKLRLGRIVPVAGGGYLLGGRALEETEDEWWHSYVARITETGDTLWTSRGEYNESINTHIDLVPLEDGGCVVAESFRGEWEPLHAARLSRVSPTGALWWQTQFGDEESDDDYAVKSLCRTPDGGFAIASTLWRINPMRFPTSLIRLGAEQAAPVTVAPATVESDFTLLPCYPNPFNASTAIRFHLSRPEHVTMSVFDLEGRQVAVLFRGLKTAGDHSITWTAQDLPSGVFLIRLATAARTHTRKAILIK